MIYFLLSILIVASCNKSDTNPQNSGQDTGVLTVSIDGGEPQSMEMVYYADFTSDVRFQNHFENDSYRIAFDFTPTYGTQFLLTQFDPEVHYVGNYITDWGLGTLLPFEFADINTERDDFFVSDCNYEGDCVGTFSGPAVHWQDSSILLQVDGEFEF